MKNKIASLIKDSRNNKNISQEKLAEHLNVSTSTISKWENGNRLPDLIVFIELCNYLDINMHDLFAKKKTNKRNNKYILLFISFICLLFFVFLYKIEDNRCTMYEITSADSNYSVIGNLFITPEYELLDVHELIIDNEDIRLLNAYSIDYGIYANNKVITHINNVQTYQIQNNSPINLLGNIVDDKVSFYIKEQADYDESIEGIPKADFYILIHCLLENKEIIEIKVPLNINKMYSN